MFSRILIANRGEIALRIIRACRELGVESVAVYSEADKDCFHVQAADKKICIGPAPSAESYLNIASLISAAEIADVDGIHPGYGFLAENSHFAEVCRSCKIEFIGPSSESMELMGNKAKARDLAAQVGIPVVPGSDSTVSTEDDALAVAHELGYPVIIKASSGGGGRGMRIAHNDISLVNGLIVAKAEAEAAFKDASVYIEKYIEKPRHVEVQVLGDKHGNIVHLGERDCSLQRRHQKLIEEAPCPILDPKLRQEIGQAAKMLAEAVQYVSAGTVEFLVDRDRNFYFIEMNCRIQVEHPVTEMVTGVDLVKEQLKVASGERLGFKQEDVKINGAAIECRINAEDPRDGFRPCPGTIGSYYVPGGPGVRVDSHIYSGYAIPAAYDSLISKLIVHRATRRSAIACMKRALAEYVIEGIKTTIPLYQEIFGHRAYLTGRFDTSFIEDFIV